LTGNTGKKMRTVTIQLGLLKITCNNVPEGFSDEQVKKIAIQHLILKQIEKHKIGIFCRIGCGG
jgi:hypothetical protein